MFHPIFYEDRNEDPRHAILDRCSPSNPYVPIFTICCTSNRCGIEPHHIQWEKGIEPSRSYLLDQLTFQGTTNYEFKVGSSHPGNDYLPTASHTDRVRLKYLVTPTRLELAASALKGQRANQLHHGVLGFPDCQRSGS